MQQHKIKYVDVRPITIPYLTYHKGGVDLPSGDNILIVSDAEKRHLLKMRNGINPCFELIRERKSKDEININEDLK